MYSYKNGVTAEWLHRRWVGVLVLLLLMPAVTSAGEFDASVAPRHRYLLKIYPKLFFTSDYFSNEGKALNLDKVTGLLYLEVPAHLQYGLTGSLSIGMIVPLGWTYQEVRPDIRRDPINRLTVRECWLTLQHRWLTLPIISSSSIRIKIPLAHKKDWEDGLRIGDRQVDLFPVYYFDYFSKTQFWYTELALGYKYRFKTGTMKPFDELNFKALLGYELLPDLKIRFFIYADLTAFRNGEFGKNNLEFFQQEGSLHTFGYGLSLWPRPSMRLEIATAGDWSGRNQYRGMRWMIGIAKVI